MIDQNKLVYLINRTIGSKGQKLKKQNEYMWWSPFVSHHKPKLQINIVTQKWHCWVSSQGGHKLYQLFKKVNATQEQLIELREIVGESKSLSSNQEKVKEKVCVLPKEFLPLENKHSSTVYKHAMFYLNKRGITKEDILKYGQLNFFVGRDIFESKMNYRNSPTHKDIIGFDLFINWDEPIVLCEGPFDAIAIKRNAIPLFGKTILSKLKRKIIEKKVKTIYISLDTDAVSDAMKMVEDFMNHNIDVYFVKLTEKDPSDLGFEKVTKLLKETDKMKFSDLMRMRLNGKTKRYMEI